MEEKSKKKPEEGKSKFFKWFLNKWAFNSSSFEQLLRLERESKVAVKNTKESLDKAEISTRNLVEALRQVSSEIGHRP
jgi:hypothetical protein